MIDELFKCANLEELEKEKIVLENQIQYTTDNDYSTQSEVELSELKEMHKEIVELIKNKKSSNGIKIVRVKYGKSSVPKVDREYQLNGFGPVGTLSEFELRFPGKDFEIIDVNADVQDEKNRELANEYEVGDSNE